MKWNYFLIRWVQESDAKIPWFQGPTARNAELLVVVRPKHLTNFQLKTIHVWSKSHFWSTSPQYLGSQVVPRLSKGRRQRLTILISEFSTLREQELLSRPGLRFGDSLCESWDAGLETIAESICLWFLSGGSLHAGASFKVGKANFAAWKRVRRTAKKWSKIAPPSVPSPTLWGIRQCW